MKVLLLMFVMVIAGCVGTEPTSTKNLASEEKTNNEVEKSEQGDVASTTGMICKRERVTGSYRTTKVCRTKVQRDQDKERAAKFRDDVRQESLTVQGGDG